MIACVAWCLLPWLWLAGASVSLSQANAIKFGSAWFARPDVSGAFIATTAACAAPLSRFDSLGCRPGEATQEPMTAPQCNGANCRSTQTRAIHSDRLVIAGKGTGQ